MKKQEGVGWIMRKKYGIPVVCLFLVLSILLCACGNSQQEQYDAARNLFYYGQYSEARKAFRALEDYSDSKAMVTACDYQLAMIQLSNEEYLGAAAAFAALGDYGNAKGLSRAGKAAMTYNLHKYMIFADFHKSSSP